MTIDTIKTWLADAVPALASEQCTHETLIDLIQTLARQFFGRAVEQFSCTNENWNHRYARIAKTMQMDRKQLLNNKELVSLKMKDLVDELLPDANRLASGGDDAVGGGELNHENLSLDRTH